MQEIVGRLDPLSLKVVLYNGIFRRNEACIVDAVDGSADRIELRVEAAVHEVDVEMVI